MGFYSFYKILKDMLRTLFGKKILKIFIICALIFTIFFVYNECFATLSDNPYYYYIPNETSRHFDLTPLKDYYFLFGCYKTSYNNYQHSLFVSDKPFTIRTNPAGDFGYTNANGGLWFYQLGGGSISFIQDTINTAVPTDQDFSNIRIF